ncbi:MAG: hypothetical protein MUF69_04265, partial [Desulfobacterota bacterium]|nr:hypothetical protein [Thermodesulfobacteriota bacterium]
TIIGGGILFAICFFFNTAFGLTIKKTIPCPHGIDEKDILNKTIGECKKMNYWLEPKEEEIILSKGYEFSCAGSAAGMSQVLYRITPAFSTGEDGRKVLVIGGEYIGKPYDKGHRGECFECELDKLEKNMKLYLEAR